MRTMSRYLGAESTAIKKRVANYPLRANLINVKPNPDPLTKGPVIIGNDVWIGSHAIILSGIKIGDGAVIGAGSVVSQDIPPYHVAAGNPARIVGKRFDRDVINKLNAIKWWNWSDERIKRAIPDFYGSIKNFVEKYYDLSTN